MSHHRLWREKFEVCHGKNLNRCHKAKKKAISLQQKVSNLSQRHPVTTKGECCRSLLGGIHKFSLRCFAGLLNRLAILLLVMRTVESMTLQATSVPPEEMDALQDLFESTSGPNWWAFGVPWNFTGVHNPCTEAWEGIECTCWATEGPAVFPYTIGSGGSNYYYDDGTGVVDAPCHINKLFLGFAHLRGSLPSSIGDLLFLTHVHMEFNALSGTISTSLGSLKYLQILSVFDNGLKGTVPTTVGLLTAMINLHLNANLLTGPLPSSMGLLASVKQLGVYSNSLTGSIPTSLGHLSRLQNLGLFQNSLTGPIPSSLGNLTALQQLHLEYNRLSSSIPLLPVQELVLGSNYLTSNIPSALGSATVIDYLDIFINLLTGSIPLPLGNLTALTHLDLGTNLLTGSIPPSLGHLTRITKLYLNTNSLTWSIPLSLGNLTALTHLYLDSNMLTGSMGCAFEHLTGLSFLDMGYNSISSSIPSYLENLTHLQYIYIDGNLLTGSIPPSLGNLIHLEDLDLSDNSISHSLPSALCSMRSLEFLFFHTNGLSGSLPKSLSDLTKLQVLMLHNNFLSGNVDDVFDPQLLSRLEVVSLSSNQLSGTLSPSLFLMMNVTTIAMVQNCFSGTLPLEICSAQSLQVLALDGLHSATACQERFFPHSPTITTYYLEASRSMRGSIPSCIFSLPNLTTLHLSGNAFTGRLGGIAHPNNELSDLSLAHNILTGSIPNWIQHHQWTSLNLAYNRLSGTLAPSLVMNNNSGLALLVNRLSGAIPSSLKPAPNISILEGNLFSCKAGRSSLPSHDPQSAGYECGSNNINFSLIAWMVCVAAFIASVGLLRWTCVAPASTDLPPHNSIALLIHRLTPSTWAQRFDSPTLVFEGSRRGALYFTIVALCILLPTYGLLSVHFKNHHIVYTWAVSMSFLSGAAAATIIIVIWFLLGGLACYARAARMTSTGAATDVISGRVLIAPAAAHDLSSSKEMSDNMISNSSTAQPQPQPQPQICSPKLLSAWGVFVVVNFVIIGGLNFAYVTFITVGISQSAQITTVLEMLLGSVKGVWNGFVLPMSFDRIIRWERGHSMTLGSEGIKVSAEWTLFHLLVICNNILVPCIMEALVDPNCFNTIIVQAPAIDAAYSYPFCSSFGSGPCQPTENSVSVNFNPPFIYNYQCSSALLSNYAAVYVYSMTFSSFVTPVIVSLYDFDKAAAEFKPARLSGQLVNLFAILVTFGVVFPLLCVVVLVAVYVETWFVHALMARFVAMAHDDGEKRGRVLTMEVAGAVVLETVLSSAWLLLPLSASFNAFFVFDTLGDDVGYDQALGGMFAVLIVFPMSMWGCCAVMTRMIHHNPSPSPSPSLSHYPIHPIPPRASLGQEKKWLGRLNSRLESREVSAREMTTLNESFQKVSSVVLVISNPMVTLTETTSDDNCDCDAELDGVESSGI